MLESRRAAVLGLSSRMAELLGERTGGRVGYAVRNRRESSALTRIEVLTEGLFIRRLQNDPALVGVGTVIFDEFHERTVNTDLALALTLDLRRMGAALRLLLMSATLDAENIAAFLAGADGSGLPVPVIHCPGRVFPVDISYRPLRAPDRGLMGREKFSLGRECALRLKEALLSGGPAAGGLGSGQGAVKNTGDILVFFPGKREIEDAKRELSGGFPDCAGFSGFSFEVLVLHGGLSLEKQREIIAPRPLHPGPPGAGAGRKRRIILSTNVAETALTIPGINFVVDSGYVRLERYHLSSGMNRLVLEPASQRSADQRAGRAGRLAGGSCLRLWDSGEMRPGETEPEIRRTDLSGLVLECLIWGVKSPDQLQWPTPPQLAAWEKALETLKNLGAADGNLAPTGAGREMARLGTEPPLAALCLAGRSEGKAALACVSAALLTEGTRSTPPEKGWDFAHYLSLVRNDTGDPWSRRVLENAREFLSRLGDGKRELSWTLEEEAGVGDLLAWAFPGRIARLREPAAQAAEPGKYRFASGREGSLPGSPPPENGEWIAAPEVDAGERSALIRLSSPVSPERALAILEPQVIAETTVEWKGLTPRTNVRRRAGKIPLSGEKRQSTRDEAARALPELLAEGGLGLLPWEDDNAAPRRLLDRIRFFAGPQKTGDGDGGYWSDEALAQDAQWLIPFIWDGADRGKGPVISPRGLVQALQTRLGWGKVRELDEKVPAFFALPGGKKRPLDYASGEPVVKARLRDCFGLTGENRVMGRRVIFHLLSPADRPIQITGDLDGFWKGSYAEVRKELRGRYPKHHWPENPESLS